MLRAARELAGVLLKDWWRYVTATSHPSLNGDDADWVRVCNRIERLERNPDGRGVRCLWQFGSDLHAPLRVPHLGRRLLTAALRDWPIKFADTPNGTGPRISFVFAHGGKERLRQLQWTLRSVFAQVDVEVECIVVDQSPEPLADQFPASVKSVRLDKAGVAAGWHKSWAFNVGAKHATGEILVFQDGDVCVPERYATEVWQTLSTGGCQAASLQRLLFYFDHAGSDRVYAERAIPTDVTPARIFQNWKGGTIAIRREAFAAVGGFDEGFVDWGGEDDEFYDRCQVVGHCRYGFLPFVHLWHPPQPDRLKPGNVNTAEVLPRRMAIPPVERVAELQSRQCGDVSGPRPSRSYKQEWADALAGRDRK